MLTNSMTHGAIALGKAVQDLYAQGQTDYSLEPVVLTDSRGEAVGRIQNGDAVIFCCRRGEREIELTEAFTESGFDRFPRPDLQDLKFVILTLYHEKFKDLPVAFAPSHIRTHWRKWSAVQVYGSFIRPSLKSSRMSLSFSMAGTTSLLPMKMIFVFLLPRGFHLTRSRN